MVVYTFTALVIITCQVHPHPCQIDLCCLATEATKNKRSVQKATQVVMVVIIIIMVTMMVMIIIIGIGRIVLIDA